jgi:hypothetical protein
MREVSTENLVSELGKSLRMPPCRIGVMVVEIVKWIVVRG